MKKKVIFESEEDFDNSVNNQSEIINNESNYSESENELSRVDSLSSSSISQNEENDLKNFKLKNELNKALVGENLEINNDVKIIDKLVNDEYLLNSNKIKKWSSGYKQNKLKKLKLKYDEIFQKLDLNKIKEIKKIEKNYYDDPLNKKLLKSNNDKEIINIEKFYLKYTLESIHDSFPNRYKIKPGYMWDGVDRSNGYESNFLNK